MTEKNDKNQESNNPSQNTDVVDMLLSKNEDSVVDFETMILETQKRVWGSLKKGYEYSGMADESEKFLRKNVFLKLDMVV
ncbi:MAG: adenylate/guanylate cyclase domain-containing protein, partial [Nitrosopumilus sp.]|nr:adenylate/guanylate cyclase domain-containing protein [Nitrosopumilus sp.]